MKNIKRILTFVLTFALALSVCVSAVSLLTAKKANADETKTYDISEVYSGIQAGGELSMVFTTVYSGNAVNYGDTVEFEYKMRSKANEYGHYARTSIGIGSYGIYFKCSGDTSEIWTCILTDSAMKRQAKFTTVERLPFATFNKMSLKAEKKNDSTVTLTMTYHKDGNVETITHDFAYDASSDMKFRFGDTNVNENIMKSTKEAVEPAEPVTYDISEVYDIQAGGEHKMVHATKYEGTKALNYGDTVKFMFKERADENSDKNFSRFAFSIGNYGFYFYHSVSVFGIRTSDLTKDISTRWGRGSSNIVTIENVNVFKEYRTISVTTALKDASTVTLTMVYNDGTTDNTITKDFAKVADSDMKFRFGDTDIEENFVKSTLAPPVFGDGSFTYASYVEGVNVYGGCKLSVIASDKAAQAGVPEGFTGNVLKMSNADKPGQTDMALDFSALNYKRKFITGLSFRVYIAGTSSDNNKHPEFRIPYPGKADNWVVGGGLGANKTNEWITISLTSDQLDKICIDGYLKTVAVCLRTNAATTMYIDKIELTTIEFENEPPVISAPVTEFKVTEGAYPVPTDKIATVTDNSGEYSVSYEWSEGALDSLGRLTKGTHTCTIVASDRCDNTATLDITYIVEAEPEVALYKITFKVDGMDDVIIEYCEDEIEYIELPTVPEKAHYKFTWESFTFDMTDNQVVGGIYVPEVYTITYMVGYDVYETATYTVENMTIDEPRVPTKKGYDGKWEDYYLNFTDVTVHAIYTRKDEKPSESESISEEESIKESTSQSEKESSDESKVESNDTSDNPNESMSDNSSASSSKGCGSNAYGIAILSILSVASIVMIKRKKEN